MGTRLTPRWSEKHENLFIQFVIIFNPRPPGPGGHGAKICASRQYLLSYFQLILGPYFKYENEIFKQKS